MRVLVTGCNGFVGSSLVKILNGRPDIEVIGSCRNVPLQLTEQNIELRHFQLTDRSNLDDLLQGIDVVVHTAGIAHDTSSKLEKDKDAYFDINTNATLDLAKSSVANGISKFIFISSIKVNGEYTSPGQPFDETSIENPKGHYAVSKYHAELGLKKISKKTGIKVCILRPSLIYGPEPKGNLKTLSRLIKNGIPLPVGSIKQNQRSILHIENLVSLIIECIFNEKSDNQTFLVSDGENLSTREIVELLGQLIGEKPRLVNVPIFLLNILGFITGKATKVNKLINSLEVDISHTKRTLNWNTRADDLKDKLTKV